MWYLDSSRLQLGSCGYHIHSRQVWLEIGKRLDGTGANHVSWMSMMCPRYCPGWFQSQGKRCPLRSSAVDLCYMLVPPALLVLASPAIWLNWSVIWIRCMLSRRQPWVVYLKSRLWSQLVALEDAYSVLARLWLVFYRTHPFVKLNQNSKIGFRFSVCCSDITYRWLFFATNLSVGVGHLCIHCFLSSATCQCLFLFLEKGRASYLNALLWLLIVVGILFLNN